MLVAFAGAYRWTIVPFGLGVGMLWIIERPQVGRPGNRLLDAALIACLAIVALQLVPLSPSVRASLSPAAVQFDRALSLGAAESLQGPSRRALSLDVTSTIWALAFGASCIGFFWCARSAFTRGGVRMTARTIAWIGLALTALVAVQRATTPKLLYWYWHPLSRTASPYGPFLNRNGLACWFAMAIPIVVGSIVARSASRGRGRVWTADIEPMQVWLVGSACLMTGGLLATLSRAGIIGSVAGLATFVWLARVRMPQKRRMASMIAAMMAMAAVATFYANLGALSVRINETLNLGAGGRARIWHDTWQMLKDFWLTGVGAGAYERGMLVYQQGSRKFFFNQAHDEYLQLLVEGGVLLAVPIVVAMAAGIAILTRRLRTDHSTHFWIRAGAASGIIAVAVQSIWDTGLRTPANAALFAVLAAIALRPGPMDRKPARLKHRRPHSTEPPRDLDASHTGRHLSVRRTHPEPSERSCLG
jgi:O-antigen ligase